MEEKIEKLEERLRNVERLMYLTFGGTSVLTVCCLAFLGFEHWRIPKEADAALRKELGDETIGRIKAAKLIADKLVALAKGDTLQVTPTSESILGTTVQKDANREYIAECDGIVDAHTGGPGSIVDFNVIVDGELHGRCTVNYGSATVPVRKGAKWQAVAVDAEFRPITPKGLVVRFIPLRLPMLDVQVKE